MLSYEEYLDLCRQVGAVAQGQSTNWAAHYGSLKAATNLCYQEYLMLCATMRAAPLDFMEDWVAHDNELAAQHREKFGCKSTEAPLNEASPTFNYDQYVELCASVSHTPYPADKIHWALHHISIQRRIDMGQLTPKAPDISDVKVEAPVVAADSALASPASPQAPETASLSWPLYVPMAISTESVPAIAWAVDIGGSAEEWTNTARTRMMHVATGLMSESIELEGFVDLANRYEELGDCYWYLAVASSVIGWDFDWVRAAALSGTAKDGGHLFEADLLFELRKAAQALQDHVVQKHLIYGRPMVLQTVVGYLDEIAYTLMCLNALYSIELPQLLEANIKKLAKRYPEGHFDTMRAAPENRDTQNELSHMVDEVSSLEEMWDTAKVVDAPASTSILWTWGLLKKGMPFECDQAGLTVDTVRAMITQRLGNDGMFSLEDIQEVLGAKLNHCSVHFNWAGENLANVWVVENEEGSTPCILLDPSNLLTPELFRVRLGQLKSPDTHANLFATWADKLAMQCLKAGRQAMARGYSDMAQWLEKAEPNYDEGYELYRRLNPTSYRIEDLEAWLLK